MKGPKGQMKYTPDLAAHIGMIAGGTGITPMLVSETNPFMLYPTADSPLMALQQIIRAALRNPLDTTKLSLVYANVGESDILLKAELDGLAKGHPDRFNVYYVLNNPPEKWDGGVGFVTTAIIKERLPEATPTSKILLCGKYMQMVCCRVLLISHHISRSSSDAGSNEEESGRTQV